MSGQSEQGPAAARWSQSIEMLNDARLLSSKGGSGRSIVNRAYYAAFYAISALLESEGKSSTKHTGVISLFDVEYVRTGRIDRAVSQQLHALFQRRNEDDYAATGPISAEDAEESMREAADIMGAVRSALAQHVSGLEDVPGRVR